MSYVLNDNLPDTKEKETNMVKVVRCKDCLLRYTNKCVLHDQAFPVNKGNNWFCADGAATVEHIYG